MRRVIGAATRIDSTSSFVMRTPRGQRSALFVGDTISLSPYLEGPPRPGSATVTKVEQLTDAPDVFIVHIDSPTRSAITGACDRDYVFLERVAGEIPAGYTIVSGPPIESRESISPLVADAHATLVAYLLLAVQRKDWHAVWDAAIDLKLLEASRR